MTTRTKSQLDCPRQPVQNKALEWEPTTLFGSFGNKMSVASSATSVSSAGTSTNTSFSARSLATSFDSSNEGTDTAKPGQWEISRHPPLWNYEVPGPESNIPNRCENEGSNALIGRTSAPPDLMDIDSEPILTRTTSLQADALDLQGQSKPNTNSTSVGRLLTERLQENPPFGDLLHFGFHLFLLILVRINPSPR